MPRRNPLDLDLLGRDDAVILDHIRDHSGPADDPDAASSSAAISSAAVETESPTRNLTSDFTHFREQPVTFLRDLGKHIAGTTYRSYDNYVGRKIFYHGFTAEMKDAVLRNSLLRERIETLADRSVKDSPLWEKATPEQRLKRRAQVVSWLEEVTATLAQKMICKFEHKRIVRVAYYIVMQILARSYNQGLHVNAEEIANLKKTAAMAAEKGQSLIFLPCHRSHIDYVCMQAICFRVGISLPTIVAGDNLNFAVIGPALNNLGAMWMRRSFGDDQLYSALIQAYVDTLLSGGFNFECFIEGGRSRLGKLLPPKFGILKFIFDTVLSGRTEDCWIVPVSTQYDRVIETESYISELLGRQKQKENLRDFFSAREILSLKLGRVDVRFHEPWSLRGYINSQIERYTPSGTPVPSFTEAAGNEQLRTRVLRSLGYEVLSNINKASVVMPTALIGTVLLTLRGRGVGHSELIRRIEWLCVRIRERGGRVADFGTLTTEQVVDRGLEVLGPLIGISGKDGKLLEPTYYAADRFQLSFYRNMAMHLFVSDAIVAVAMYTKIKQGGGPAMQRVPIKYLFEQTQWLSHLLAGEFVYIQQPGGIKANFWESIQVLRDQAVISLTEDGSVELSLEERARGREFFDFYCFLLWPFCDGYWFAAAALFMLTPVAADIASSQQTNDSNNSSGAETLWVEVNEFLEVAQLLGKTVYAQGDLSYFEAVNKEVLRSAFNEFEAEGILVVRRSKSGRTPAIMSLSPEWVPTRYSSPADLHHDAGYAAVAAAAAAAGGSPAGGLHDPGAFSRSSRIKPEGRLWDYVERISVFRREGKNRRDSPSVSVRVLALADDAGRRLKQRRLLSVEEASRPATDALVKVSRGRRDVRL
ncbi:acyltransferase [Myxozyma melibiosi]|uniref:Acyltransferase n=1 Tax=Myxozyma melibiosi TaxID=54550 RepID=A0ABR1F4C7_9ASCO